MNPALVRLAGALTRIGMSRKPMAIIAAASLSLANVIGCNPFADGTDCITSIPPSLQITVLDSATRSALAVKPTLEVRNKDGQKMTVEPIPFSDSLPVTEYWAYGGASTFSVFVGAQGYRDHAQTGIRVVNTGACKMPARVDVEVNLVKTS